MGKTLFYNADVYSVGLDGRTRRDSAVLIDGEKIAAVGSFGPEDIPKLFEDVKECPGTGEEIFLRDLKGAALLSGFADTHLHVSSTAEMVLDQSLYYLYEPGIDTRETLIKKYTDRVKAFAASHPDVPVVRAVGWDPAMFAELEGGAPTAADLDAAVSDRPAMLTSYDHHSIWVNTCGLKTAGITKDTPDPRNGRIERDKNGDPTGIIREFTAIDYFKSRVPGADYTIEEYKRGILAYQEQYGLPFGTMLVFDALTSKSAAVAFKELAQEGKLKMRVRACYVADPAQDPFQFDRMIEEKGKYDVGDLFKIQTIKFFVDGSGLSFFLEKPFEKAYLDDVGLPEDYLGYAQWEEDELKEAFLKLNDAGYQIHVHCMGAGAVERTLNAFEYAAKEGKVTGSRHVIAHVMNIQEKDLERMARLNVIAAMQPMWPVVDDLTQISCYMMGEERALDAYPLGKLHRAGVRITCGTDFPVTIPPSPFLGMASGMTRKMGKGSGRGEQFEEKVLAPKDDPDVNKVSADVLAAGYTSNGAYQLFLEDTTGTLAGGMSADFVILDGPFPEDEPETIRHMYVKEAYFKGEKVYAAPEKRCGQVI